MADKRLVRDLMTVGVPSCPPETALPDLAAAMLAHGWEAVVVLDEHGHAVGWVGEDHLVAACAREADDVPTAEQVMDPELPAVPPDIPIRAAAQIMCDRRVRVLYITHHAGGIEYPAAWLTYRHLVRRLSGDDMPDAGIQAAREAPLDVFLRRREAARRRVLGDAGEGRS